MTAVLTTPFPQVDRSWDALVARVDAHISDHGLSGLTANHVRQAVWRALARRPDLADAPADLEDWVRLRVAIEAHRVEAHLAHVRSRQPLVNATATPWRTP